MGNTLNDSFVTIFSQ